jgi:hypothetical protein
MARLGDPSAMKCYAVCGLVGLDAASSRLIPISLDGGLDGAGRILGQQRNHFNDATTWSEMD